MTVAPSTSEPWNYDCTLVQQPVRLYTCTASQTVHLCLFETPRTDLVLRSTDPKIKTIYIVSIYMVLILGLAERRTDLVLGVSNKHKCTV